MRFLDELELLLTEEKSTYTLYPVDYNLESGVSFGVDKADTEDILAKITVKNLEGVAIDALSGNYHYDDVYVDIDIEKDIDKSLEADLLLWVLKKVENMGYNRDGITVDGNKYYEQPDDVSDVADENGEPAETDEDAFDPSTYWKNTEDEDEEDKNRLGTSYKIPDDPAEADSEDAPEKKTGYGNPSDEEEDEHPLKKKKKKQVSK